MMGKRAHSPELPGHDDQAIVLKKQRAGNELAIAGTITKEGMKRTSNLYAPIMKLEGHQGEVFSMRFSPDGASIASASFDKNILLWRTFGENCENYMLLKGHKNAVQEVHWSPDGERILSCSADKTVRAWDAWTGEQIKKATEHTNFVNSVCPMRKGPPLFVSGGDDSLVKVWDMRRKRSVTTLDDKYQVLSVECTDAGDMVISAGIDNTIKVWDLRKGQVFMTLKGHSDTVTGVRVSPDGTHILSNSMDNTLRVWDLRPFAPANRCVKVFTGHQHSFEKTMLRCNWSADGLKVTCGSADRTVYVWDSVTRRLMYKLPGHMGSVNEAVFHPTEPIIGSCSSDKSIYLGELAM